MAKNAILYHSDNLKALSKLKPLEGKVSLIYMDPPFFTQKRQIGKNGSFDDTWDDAKDYLRTLHSRIVAYYQLLAPHGNLIIHVDPRTSHYVKNWTDSYIGSHYFLSEIIWRYRRWPSKTPNFQKVHDVLLRYGKDPKQTRFNQLYEPLAPSTLKVHGTGTQQAVIENGKRLRTSVTKKPSPGVPLGDVWDIGIIAPSSKERTGWPTQKPEALLERIILSMSNPGDLVIDPYCGSGTAIAVAQRLGRLGIGIDQNADAIKIARKRLAQCPVTAWKP